MHVHNSAERLNAMLDSKKAEYTSALNAGDPELAEKIREQMQAMIVEMRMVNPAIALSAEEKLMVMWSNGMTNELHNDLNKKDETSTR